MGVVSGVLNLLIPALERRKGDHAKMKHTTKMAAVAAGAMVFDDWFDPIGRARGRGGSATTMEA